VGLKEEYRLGLFEDRVIRRIFGPKREKVSGELRKLHDEEFHNLYSSPNIIKVTKSKCVRRDGHVARTR
jgi:hypothetical protein